jgi:hypothetical protein
MKYIIKSAFAFSVLFYSSHLMAQSGAEQEIRTLEQLEVQAVLKGDTATLFNKLWAPEFIVNNPANIVVTKEEVSGLIKAGMLDYETFTRTIDKVSIIDHTAIAMGSEEVLPKGVTNHTGKSIIRRYTDIWMNRSGSWKLVGRQATIASIR